MRFDWEAARTHSKSRVKSAKPVLSPKAGTVCPGIEPFCGAGAGFTICNPRPQRRAPDTRKVWRAAALEHNQRSVRLQTD